MKRKIFLLFLIFVLSFIFNYDVYASAGFSGEGTQATSAGSGRGSGTSSGYSFQLAPILRFTLVNVSDSSKIIPVVSNVMINKNTNSAYLYDEIFVNDSRWASKNIHGNGAVVGYIDGNGKYTSIAYSKENFPEFSSEYYFSSEQIKKILPFKWGTNFNVNELKAAVLKDSSCMSDCKITDQYEKIVLNMLRKGNIINDSSSVHLEQLSLEDKGKLGKYRMLVEPIYSLKSGENYQFVTLKALGIMIGSGGDGLGYGISITHLYNNILAKEKVGPINKKYSSDYILASDDLGKQKALSDANDGAGYALIRLSYDIPDETPVCRIEKNLTPLGDKFLFYNLDGIQETDVGSYHGKSFENILQYCSCDIVDNSEYKSELLNDSVYNGIYSVLCDQSEDIKCDYKRDAVGNYTFFDEGGDSFRSYEEILSPTCCESTRIKELAEADLGFEDIYDSYCKVGESRQTDSTFGYCKVNNTVNSIHNKDINMYCKSVCTEDISFYDVDDTSSIDVKAGQFFSLSNPKLSATKKCTITFDYNNWKTKYVRGLEKLVDSYNVWQKYKEADEYSASCGSAGNYKRYYYESSYTGLKINSDGLTLSKEDYSDSFSNGCNNGKIDVGAAKNNYEEFATVFSKLVDVINECNNAASKFKGNDFYNNVNFSNELEFVYEQDILKSDIIQRNKSENAMNSEYIGSTNECSDGKCEFASKFNYYDNDAGKNIPSIVSNDVLSRSTTLKYQYSPSVTKYVNPLTGLIGASGTYLGKVYDVELKAVPKNGNNNYYKFTALGENVDDVNSLYTNVISANAESLTRYCKYNISNEIIKCEEEKCESGVDAVLNVIYRSVDPSNIDPNGRLNEGDSGFDNWQNIKGEAVMNKIQNTANNTNVYSPDNLEYSFKLSSDVISQIRDYNASVGNIYDDDSLVDCNGVGNECLSKFITDAYDGTGDFETKFCTNKDGRDRWKYMTFNEISNHWYVEEYKKGDMTEILFNDYKSRLGNITP